jgi:hypothetical protein
MTRIEAARRRAAGAKQIAAAVAAAGFLGVVLLARDSHPGHAATAPSQRTSAGTSSTSTQSGDSFDFGSSSVAPSSDGSSSPQAQTSVS